MALDAMARAAKERGGGCGSGVAECQHHFQDMHTTMGKRSALTLTGDLAQTLVEESVRIPAAASVDEALTSFRGYVVIPRRDMGVARSLVVGQCAVHRLRFVTGTFPIYAQECVTCGAIVDY